MRIGMYNRWLMTLGGGERYSLAIAEYLSRRHPVTVISHLPVSKETAASRLNLDLSRVEFLFIPDRPSQAITPLTAEYDYFINVSFLDFFPTLSRHSSQLIYFPIPLHKERELRFRSQVAQKLKKEFLIPTLLEGVLNLDPQDGSLIRLGQGQIKLELPATKKGYPLDFQLSAPGSGSTPVRISLDDRVIQEVRLSPAGRPEPVRLHVSGRRRRIPYELTIAAEMTGKASPQISMSRFHLGHPRYSLYRLFFEYGLKDWGFRLHRNPLRRYSLLESIDSYDIIWAISEFTHHWIQRYWQRPSAILYPPVDVEQFQPRGKRNQILSVGRFFFGSHNKKHLVMIRAFKEMVAGGLAGWELHLAGGKTSSDAHNRQADEQYIDQLVAEAQGYPIHLHFDIPFQDLVALYGESSLYWHATGYGEDEEQEPIKFEHFGITTVEAMASGCVPVVIAKGGQPEIVQSGKNGFLWNTLPELQEATQRLIDNPALRRELSGSALRAARGYGREAFFSRLDTYLRQIGVKL